MTRRWEVVNFTPEGAVKWLSVTSDGKFAGRYRDLGLAPGEAADWYTGEVCYGVAAYCDWDPDPVGGAAWRDAEFRPEEAHTYESAEYDLEAAKEHRDAGGSADEALADHNRRVSGVCLSPLPARSDGRFDDTDEDEAAEWADFGFTADEAADWRDHNFYSYEAHEWRGTFTARGQGEITAEGAASWRSFDRRSDDPEAVCNTLDWEERVRLATWVS